MSKHFGVLGLTSTYALWSLANVIVAMALFGAIGVFYQSLFLFLCFLIVAKKKNPKASFKESKIAIVHAIFRMLGMCFLMSSLLFIKVGIVDTIIACNIFFVILILAPIGGEKAKPIMLVPLLTSVVGVALICIQRDASTNTPIDIKLLLPVGAMICLAMAMFLWRKCSEGIAPATYLSYMHGWVSVLCIPFIGLMIMTDLTVSTYVPTLKQVLLILTALTIGTLGDVIFTVAQKFSSYTQNALIAPSAAVFSSIFGWVLASQQLSSVQMIGMAVVITSVSTATYISVREKRLNKSLEQNTAVTPEIDPMPQLAL